MSLSRRAFLTQTGLIGCSLAASPLVTPVSFAATPGENRLIVIILRGGMDGMGVVTPYGDPNYAALRGALPFDGPQGAIDLDGFFALHPALAPLMPMWQAGQLAFAHAVSTPYRDKRSHFDGQDILEAGISDLSQGLSRDGWLNRMLQHYPGVTTETAYAVGRDALMVLNGAAPVLRWSPNADLALSPQALRLAEIVMAEDPAMAAALAKAYDLADSDGDPIAVEGGMDEMMAMVRQDMKGAAQGRTETRVAKFVADRLSAEARVAAFSLNGWDTHNGQARSLPRALGRLAQTLLALQADMAPGVWDRTAIVAMTEFGRTARMNGTKGTDHGTGGAMLMAGGAIRGGRVFTDWPGLSEADLFDRRDLMPTSDVRRYAGWLMPGLFGLSHGMVEGAVFPGVDLGADPGLLA
ncbi:MAG: DUF1501 domain-containing protein [Paracoccaceae bacterium]|nr:DUF1501 domain-containing protein [Paracoccaceae bacterium]